MHLCDMQLNRISMESAKCAQSNKTCRQSVIKGNNKITELRTILQRESQNS